MTERTGVSPGTSSPAGTNTDSTASVGSASDTAPTTAGISWADALRCFAAMLRWDVRLQVRYGFYTVYVVVTTLFVLGLRLVPPSEKPTALVLVLFGDPAVLGFYFVAALVLFEKSDGTLDALVGTPLSSRSYLASKALSLTLLALLASLVVAVATVGFAFDPLFLLGGVALNSVLVVQIGFVAVARFDTLNAYFMTALVYMTPFSLPLLGFVGIEHPLLYLIPTQASVLLLRAAVEPIALWQVGYALCYLPLSIAVAGVVANRAFRTHVVERRSRSRDHAAARPNSKNGSGMLGGSFEPVRTLVLADLRNWRRDPLLVYVAAAPFLGALVGRWGVPVATDWLSTTGFDLVPYYPLVVSAFALLAPLVFGFVAGFFVLEERDAGVLAALVTTPLTGRGYLAYRVAVIVAFALVYPLVVVPIVGILTVPLSLLVSVSSVAALWAPLSGLALAALASNSVEGVAISKLLGLFMLAPLVAIPVLPWPLELVVGIDPLYWPVKALVVGLGGAPSPVVAGYLVVGAVIHLVCIAALVRRFGP